MTNKEELILRQQIVDEAKTWLGTKWHHEARIKGAGVDCGLYLLETYKNVGLVEDIKVDHYPKDFMFHRNEEFFIELIQLFSHEILEPPYLPGDVIIFRFGRIFSHAAIILDWPNIIHSDAKARCVCIEDVEKSRWSNKLKKVFRYKDFKANDCYSKK
jgi:cell wall-associated NlpC family hydrolase